MMKRKISAVLALLTVMMMASTGVVYLAEPAVAGDDCTPDTAITLGAGDQDVDGVTFTLTWTGTSPDYTGFSWTNPSPTGAEIRFRVDRSSNSDSYTTPTFDADSYSAGGTRHIDALWACGQYPEGGITIGKSAPGAGNTDFAFTGDLGTFLLKNGHHEYLGRGAGTYVVNEPVDTMPAGWAVDSVSCSLNRGEGPLGYTTPGSGTVSIDLAWGQDVDCTFTNVRSTGRIIITKDTEPESSGFYQQFEFSPSWGANFMLTDDQSYDSGWTLAPLGGDGPADGYSIAEINLPSGWSQTSVTCTGGEDPMDIDLSAGETVTCDFVNTTAKGRIIIVKETEPDGSSQAFEFDPSWSDANFSLADGGSQDSGWTLDPKSGGGSSDGYSITEVNLPAGWSQGSVSCTGGDQPWDLDLSAGETITCTFVNRQSSSITIVKEAEGAGTTLFPFVFDPPSGSDVPFNLQAGGSQAFTGLGAGDYEIRDNPPAGWGLLGVECQLPTGADADWAIDGNGDVDVDLDFGQDVTCTFTNTNKGILRVEKRLVNDDRGLASCEDFSFSVNGGDPIAFEPDCVNEIEAQPGVAYTVTEPVVPAAYSSSIPTSGDYDCTNVMVGAGQTRTCKITNNDRQGWYWLTVVKNLVNDDGGTATCANFSFSVNGGAAIPFEADCSNWLAFQSVPAGGLNVVEPAASGYETTYSNCSPVLFARCDGWSATCTITNDDVSQGTIEVVKETLPDGAAAGFTFTGIPVGADADGILHDNDPVVSWSAPAGSYPVSETVPAGWDLTGIVCTDPDSGTSVDLGTATATIDLDAGETVRCTFTNRQDGRIEVEKQTLPDGSGQLFSFTGDIAASLTDGQSAGADVDPGMYHVAEGAVAGWDLTGISCNDTDSGVDAQNPSGAVFYVDPGETVRCTFTNTQWGGIYIAKQTLPDGSLQGFEFVGLGGDNPPATLADNGLYGWRVSAGGPYTVSEVNVPDGWELYQISCDDGSSQTPSTFDLGDGEAYINVDPGETVRCTFRNRQFGRIIVDKVTFPAGDPQQFTFNPSWSVVDFPLTDAGAPVSSGWLPQARNYSVSETVPTGWDLTDAGCVVTAGPDLGDTLAPNGFDLKWGQTVTCTFENTKRGEIIVKKVTTPDDVPAASQPVNGFEFDPSWSGSNFFLHDYAAPGDEHSSGLLVPGTYEVDEVNVPAGWTLTNASCTGTEHQGSFDPEDGFTLEPGEVVTCTFEDFLLPDGSLLIIKDANPNDGTSFSYNASAVLAEGGAWGPHAFLLVDQPGSNSRLFEDLETGDFMVTEGALGAGWQFDGVSCVDTTGSTVAATVVGQSVTVHVSRYQPGVACTFRNSGYGRIIINKVTGPAGAPAESFGFDPSWGADFQLTNGQSHNSGLVLGGVYSVTEWLSPAQVAAGWKLASASCGDDSAVNAIGVSVGETVTCTFINLYDPEASLVIRKEASPLNSPDDTLFTFSGDLGAFDLLDGEAEAFTVDPNVALSITELVPEGWQLTDVRCTGVLSLVPPAEGESTALVTVAQNGHGECVFYNLETGTGGPTGSLTIEKITVPAGAEGFGFTPSANLGGGAVFTLGDGDQQTFTELEPGTYIVSESGMPASADANHEWQLESLVCEGAADYTVDTEGESVTVSLGEGEVARCTFTNTLEEVEGPGDLPYTGSDPYTMPLLLTGLWALLMGLALWVWSLMRQNDRA